jgi:diacylglycerol kinase
MQKWHNRSLKDSLTNALRGWRYAFGTQKNFKIHALVSVGVILIAWWRCLVWERWLILGLAIVLGLVIEMANTAMEKIVDLVTEEYSEKAKLAKDIAAGMMLLTAAGLAIIGLLTLFG